MYLELLDLMKILFILSLGVIFLYFLVKRFSLNKNIQYITIIKVFIIYETISLFFYLIYPKKILTEIFKSNLTILDFFLYSVILYLIFSLIIKKYFIIKIKKIIAIYLLLFFLFLPFLNILGNVFVIENIKTLSPFRSEIVEIENSFSKLSLFEIATKSYYVSFLSKTINIIENGTITWSWNSIELILATQDFSKIRFQRLSPL